MNSPGLSKHIVTEQQDGILRIVMNRPEKKNALTIAMYSALADAIEQAEQDRNVRVLLIHGAGDSFTSGNDLKDFLETPPRDSTSPVFRFMRAIRDAKMPVVAAVEGLAVGIGTTMLFHCDLVYAGAHAKFLMPFVNLGLCPEAGSSMLLPLLAGHQQAAELLLLGEMFTAEKAREIGLINDVCEDSQVLELALEKAHRLTRQPQASVRLAKAQLKAVNHELLQRVMAHEISDLLKRLVSPEAKEAFSAFLERRKPDFSAFQ
ncbi:MAG: enoyl-CoA hydratase [Candidatus Zixiibacteriota bacterium]